MKTSRLFLMASAALMMSTSLMAADLSSTYFDGGQNLTPGHRRGSDKTLAEVLNTKANADDVAAETVQVQRISVGYAALVAAGTGNAALFGTAIPDNAIIKRAYYDVTTTFAGNGNDGSTIKVGLEDQDNDVVAAVAISDAGNPWDAGLQEGIQDGTMAAALKLTAARKLAVTWTTGGTDTALSAGALDFFVEWVPGQ